MIRRTAPLLLLPLLALASASLPAANAAQASPGPDVEPEQVLSRSQDLALTAADYRRMVREMSAQKRSQLAGNPEALIDKVMDLHSATVLAEKAEKQGLAEDPDVAAQLHKARRNVLVGAYMQRLAGKAGEPPNLDALARERYLATKRDFQTVERRRLAHILIRPDSPHLSDEYPTPRELTAHLRDRLRQGASFAELARQYSEDPSSAAGGGELPGWQRKDGMFVPPFEEAAFALKHEGELSEPVKTQFGYHLIKLLELEPSEQLGYEQVAERIKSQLRKQFVFSQLEQERGDAYPRRDSIDVEALRVLLLEGLENESPAAETEPAAPASNPEPQR